LKFSIQKSNFEAHLATHNDTPTLNKEGVPSIDGEEEDGKAVASTVEGKGKWEITPKTYV